MQDCSFIQLAMIQRRAVRLNADKAFKQLLRLAFRTDKGWIDTVDHIAKRRGGEFVILLRATDEKAALHFAERIRYAVQSGFDPPLPFPLRISIGLAQYLENDTLERLIYRADKALYHAKQTGRNNVVAWSPLAMGE